MVGINNSPTSEPSRDDAVVRPVNSRLAALAGSTEPASFTTWNE
jgi:hypothetical protein